VRLSPRHPISSKFAFIGGVTLTGAVATAMLVRWLVTAAPPPADLAPYRPMALDAAGGLALGAMGLIALWRRRPRAAAALGILVAALGIVSLAEYGLGLGGGGDLPAVPPPGSAHWALSEHHLSPLAALEFLTLGFAIVAAAGTRAARRRTLILFTSGSIVAAVAALAGVAPLSAALAHAQLERLQGMSAGSALGLLATGASLMALARWAAPEPRAAPDAGPLGDAAPLVGLAFGVLIAITFLSFQWIANGLKAEMRAKFGQESMDLVDDIGDRMPTYALAMRGSAHYLQQVGLVSPDEWAAHVRALQIIADFPGILGYGYADRVAASGLRAHLRRMEKMRPGGYRLYPPGERPEYFPVVLLEPATERSRKVIGLDHYAEQTRRKALQEAGDSGHPTISNNVTLVLDQGKPHLFGFQMYMPVYRKGLPVATEAQRRLALMGAVFTPFRIDALVRGVLADQHKLVRVRVLDGALAQGAQLVYDSSGGADGSILRAVPPNTLSTGAIILGRRWTILTTPLPPYFNGEGQGTPWIVLASGVLISVLLAAAIWQVFAIQARARSLAAAQALNAETESRLRAEQALMAEREQARLKVEALNRQLSRRAAELENANRELEAFSYSVSHDLQQPVSGIAGYSGMALEDFTERMAPEVKEIFERIQAASYRMSRLIAGLLALSSLSRAEIKRTAVNLSSLARDAIGELRIAYPERSVDVQIAAGLTAQGDKHLLQGLLNNLLGNAWKYTGKTPEPRIVFGLATTEQGAAYFVRDNGAGFDPAQAGRLFTAFQRLHKESEFPGTGIGLATAARIVARHGGKIWAEAQRGQGATFYFTLPAEGPEVAPDGASAPGAEPAAKA
jgi:signal transduction histidine kinase